jgi:hypothetical protein
MCEQASTTLRLVYGGDSEACQLIDQPGIGTWDILYDNVLAQNMTPAIQLQL